MKKSKALEVIPYFLCTVWWIILYPGIFSVDSASYALGVSTTNFSSDYSIWWPVYLYLISFGGTLISNVTLFNSLVSLFAMKRFLCVFFQKEIVNRACIVLSLTPIFAAMSIHLWRDVTMAWGFLLLFSLYKDFTINGNFNLRISGILILALFGIFTRPNGSIALLLSLSVLFLSAKKFGIRRLPVLSLALVTITANFLIPSLLNSQNQGSKIQADVAFAPFLSDISCVYSRTPELLTDNNILVLQKVASREVWSNPISCGVINPIYFSPSLNREYLNSNRKKVFQIWVDAFLKNPEAVLEGRVMRASSFIPPPLVTTSGRVYFMQQENVDEFSNRFDSWIQKVFKIYIGMFNYYSNIFGWSGLWILIIIYILSKTKVEPGHRLFIITSLVSVLLPLINAPGSDARYGLTVLWCGYGLLTSFLLQKRNSKING